MLFRSDNPDLERVNVLLGTTLRGPASKERAARLKKTEVLFDRADGLDWQTIVKCDALHFVKKSGLYQRRGEVSYFRRNPPRINTPLQRGDRRPRNGINRFNGFVELWQTVETVFRLPPVLFTPLKRGVNESAR